MSARIDAGRRRILLAGAGGMLGALLARLASPGEARAATSVPRSLVVLWLNGGPSHIDTFDPKPGAATGGPFKAIPTRIAGARFAEHLPMLADQADKLAVIRSMTSKEGSHERARQLLHTGYTPNPTVLHPSLGGWVSEELGGPDSDLPAFVSIAGPSHGAGFLGAAHAPFLVSEAGAAPDDTTLAPMVDEPRSARRAAALGELERRFRATTASPLVAGRGEVYARATRLRRSARLAAFELDGEPERLRTAYGDTAFGKGCLLARRLVESGVRAVEVTLDGWDTHQDNFERVKKLSGTLDAALATLLADLDARKLLATTLVACMGEFGRSPRIRDDGRDHHPGAWSAVLAGAGLRRGIVHGATDAAGEKVAGPQVSVADLFATMTHALGMDPTKTFSTPSGRPVAITDGGSVVRGIVA